MTSVRTCNCATTCWRCCSIADYRLIDALAHPPSAGPDPIRILFLDEWQRLGQIIREAAQRGTLGSQALQFLSFMSAGDALFALDQAAPALGVRISSDDLRRLAKMIAANSTADPLAVQL